MKKISLCVALFLAMSTMVCAETVNIWLGDSSGNPLTSIDVASGSNFNVSIWYQTDDAWAHNAIALLVGFDRATAIGTGASPLDGKISLVGVNNISFPIVLANKLGGGFSATTGDRPYGVKLALGATLGSTVTASSAVKVADVTLTNNIPASTSYDMTIWNAGTGARWTSFVPMMSYLRRDATPAVLTVNSTGSSGGPVVGTNNKAVLDSIMTTAAPNYTWVLWGKVSNRTAGTFDIDDGSGVIIHVSGTNSVSNGDYVSVKGSLNPATKTLTSQGITIHLDL